MSAPAPGPNGTMNFTARVGHCWACAAGAAKMAAQAAAQMAAKVFSRRMVFLSLEGAISRER
jgi:hypothetical protein